MPEPKHQSTGHVIYTCTPDIKNIFLHEASSIVYGIKKDGIVTPPQSMSKDLMKLLEDNGCEVVETERTFFAGINYFCGIKIEITKIKEKKKIKQLFITVYGKNNREISDKLTIIQDNVALLCKDKPTVETYTKVTRC
jgi:hypothetical protein